MAELLEIVVVGMTTLFFTMFAIGSTILVEEKKNAKRKNTI